jgi:uncharacterized membrane protein
MYRLVHFGGMKSFTHSIDIAAPIERVWELTVGIEALPSLTPTITRAERLDDGPLRIGFRARLKQPGQPSRVWTVTEHEPNQRFEWTTRSRGFTMTAGHALSHADGITRNELAIHLSGPLAGLVGALGGRRIAAALATESESFRRAAEQRTTEQTI